MARHKSIEVSGDGRFDICGSLGCGGVLLTIATMSSGSLPLLEVDILGRLEILWAPPSSRGYIAPDRVTDCMINTKKCLGRKSVSKASQQAGRVEGN